MLNRLLNSTGKKLRLYVADEASDRAPVVSAEPERENPGRRGPTRVEAPPPVAATSSTANPPDALVEALSQVLGCESPAAGLAALEAAGLSPQRAAVLGGISLAAYEALRRATPAAPEWGAFQQSVAEWKERLAHS